MAVLATHHCKSKSIRPTRCSCVLPTKWPAGLGTVVLCLPRAPLWNVAAQRAKRKTSACGTRPANAPVQAVPGCQARPHERKQKPAPFRKRPSHTTILMRSRNISFLELFRVTCHCLSADGREDSGCVDSIVQILVPLDRLCPLIVASRRCCSCSTHPIWNKACTTPFGCTPGCR